jgi:hypothetical protein
MIISAARSHTGRACRNGFEVADQDRRVHERHEVRAWAPSEGDRPGERKGQVGAGSSRHGKDCKRRGTAEDPAETGSKIKELPPWAAGGLTPPPDVPPYRCGAQIFLLGCELSHS